MTDLEKKLPGIILNEPLAQYTTFKIGGPAKYFFVAKTSEEVVMAIKVAKEENTHFYILGGGSNVLISDKGFEGLVIKVASSKLKVEGDVMIADAGILLAKLVSEGCQHGLSGLEWAIGIPGTIGGAVRGNAGAYGHAIGESVESVKILDLRFKILDFNKNDCKFDYRSSIFKEGHNLVVLEVKLKLQPDDKKAISQKMQEIISQRVKRIAPHPCPGSFFKNYKLQITDKELLKKQYPLATEEEIAQWLKFKKIPAAWFIEQCGLSGKQIGGVKVSEEHANFIINAGQGKAEEVIMLASYIKQQVRDKFGVQLTEEVVYVGF